MPVYRILCFPDTPHAAKWYPKERYSSGVISYLYFNDKENSDLAIYEAVLSEKSEQK